MQFLSVHSGFGCNGYLGKKSLKALYPRNWLVSPNYNKNFRTFCERSPAIIPMVVGSDAAQTPSRLMEFSSPSFATTKGGAQAKQAVSPGTFY